MSSSYISSTERRSEECEYVRGKECDRLSAPLSVTGGTLLSPPVTSPEVSTTHVSNCIRIDISTQHEVLTTHAATQCDILTFSAAFCEEILPRLSDEEINREFSYFQLKNNKYNTNTKMNKIKNHLGIVKCIELKTCENSILECNRIIDHFSYVLESSDARLALVNEELVKAQSYIESLHTSNAVTSHSKSVSTDNIMHKPLTFLECIIDNITVADIQNNINFTHIANRQVAYFGAYPYSYSGKQHDPAPYPELSLFDNFFTEISKKTHTSRVRITRV